MYVQNILTVRKFNIEIYTGILIRFLKIVSMYSWNFVFRQFYHTTRIKNEIILHYLLILLKQVSKMFTLKNKTKINVIIIVSSYLYPIFMHINCYLNRKYIFNEVQK